MKLILATANPNKIAEIRAMVPASWEVLTSKDIGVVEEIPETGNTFRRNAAIKARWVKKKAPSDSWVLSDDSGLEVEALNGRPGVDSATFAGLPRSDKANNDRLLSMMDGEPNRRARFVTVLCLLKGDEEKYFEGEVRGKIATTTVGSEGFGYDPLFMPEGLGLTFAEISRDEKNKLSHRGAALAKFKSFVQSLQTSD